MFRSLASERYIVQPLATGTPISPRAGRHGSDHAPGIWWPPDLGRADCVLPLIVRKKRS